MEARPIPPRGLSPTEPPAAHASPEFELAALYEHAPLGFAVLDTQLRFVRVNPWLARVNGLPASAHVGRPVEEVLPGLAEQAKAARRHVLENGTALRGVEFVGDTPAAPGLSRSWVEHWFPIRDAAGRIVAIGVLVEETTEQRRLANENRRVSASLAASEARHEFLVRLHDRMRARADPAELTRDACRLLCTHLHLNRVGFVEFDRDDGSVAVGPHHAEGVPYGEGRQRPAEFGEALVAGLHAGRTAVVPDVQGDPTFTEPERHAYRRWLTGACVVVPLLEGARLAAACFVASRAARDWADDEVSLVEGFAERVRDATLRARDARRLLESEQRLRLAQEAARIGIYDADLVAGTYEWDARMRALWGVGPDEVLDLPAIRAPVPPEDLVAVDAALARATDPAGDGTMTLEHRVRHARDGRELRLLLTGVVTFRDGKAIRMVGTAQDVTALREAEFALREADRHKDEFLAMLAHELRNPLAPLRYALRTLERGEVSEPGRGALAVAQRQVAHMSRLVDDLLEVSRISRGSIRLRPESVDATRVATAVADALWPTLEERGQRMLRELPAGPLWVTVDPTRLAQVIENLLGNASKYSDAGGTITLRAGRQGGEVFVEVRDDGIGIDARDLPRVFDLFTQLDNSTDRSRGGLGIGLALVRRLVEAHGGRVTAESAGRGAGSTFTVRLPSADDPPER